MKKLLPLLIFSLLAIILSSLIIGSTHNFVIGLNPILHWGIIILLVLFAIPLMIKLVAWLKKRQLGGIKYSPAILFAYGIVTWLISGGLHYIFKKTSSLDIHLQDTCFVIAHIHITMMLIALFGLFSVIYSCYPLLFKKQLNDTLSYIHFWISFICTFLILDRMDFEQNRVLAGMPRRYIDYGGIVSPTQWLSIRQFEDLNRFLSLMAISLIAAQILFAFNLFYCFFVGQKVAAKTIITKNKY